MPISVGGCILHSRPISGIIDNIIPSVMLLLNKNDRFCLTTVACKQADMSSRVERKSTTGEAGRIVLLHPWPRATQTFN